MAISLPPHALLVPCAAQGHVIPFMELAYCLSDHGFRVTILTTEFIHKRVTDAMLAEDAAVDRIRVVPVPAEFLRDDDHKTDTPLFKLEQRVMPKFAEELILKSRKSGEHKITCIVADAFFAASLPVSKKMGLRTAAFLPASAGSFMPILNIPKLMEDGFIDYNGRPKEQDVPLSSFGLPPLRFDHLLWNNIRKDPETNHLFDHLFDHLLQNNEAIKMAEFIICNSFYDIESAVFNFQRNILPIGPLLTGQRFGKPVGHLWKEDSTCTGWLDGQPPNSVIYVAFGSVTTLAQQQFEELAYGLALMARPFLWVVRSDLHTSELSSSFMTSKLSSSFPPGYQDSVAARGKLVSWSPQQKVLAHPSIACFLSHCGWNSTMEGIRNAVPFLCWPYFADQLLNRDYICESWKIGLRLKPDDNGLITREEIRIKIEELLGNEEIRKRAHALKESAERNIQEGGASYENFIKFVEAMKE